MFLATFTDMIKNKFLEEFTGEFSASSILLSLLIAFGLGILIAIVYKITYKGVFFNKNYAAGLILSSMITSVIIATVNSNLALSLGMVGALSIVRFRTAVKDPNDTIFMFWTVATGIMSGAGFYYMSVLASFTVAVLYILVWFFWMRTEGEAALLIIRYRPGQYDELKPSLMAFGKRKERSRSSSDEWSEVIFEVKQNRRAASAMEDLQSNACVISASLVAYHGEFGQ